MGRDELPTATASVAARLDSTDLNTHTTTTTVTTTTTTTTTLWAQMSYQQAQLG